MSGTVPPNLFHKFFGHSDCWTVVASGCQIYPITEAQMPALAKRTDFKRRR